MLKKVPIVLLRGKLWQLTDPVCVLVDQFLKRFMIIDLIFSELKSGKNDLVKIFHDKSVVSLGKSRYIHIREHEWATFMLAGQRFLIMKLR